MYLFIFDDLTIKTANGYIEEDLQAVDNGYLAIIDISSDKPTEYYNGKWTEVEQASFEAQCEVEE